MPPEKVAGDYANVVTVWSTPYDFAVDFDGHRPVGHSKVHDEPAHRDVARNVAGFAIDYDPHDKSSLALFRARCTARARAAG